MKVEKEILKELFDKGLSNVQIGKELGYHNTTIGKWLKKCGFERIVKVHEKYDNCCICDKDLIGNKKNRSTCGACSIRVRRFRMKEKAIEYKGGSCVKCGYDKTFSALQFHHLNPKEKEFGIGANSNKSWDVLKVELDKCILLCGNCHSEEHNKHDDEKLLKYIKEHK